MVITIASERKGLQILNFVYVHIPYSIYVHIYVYTYTYGGLCYIGPQDTGVVGAWNVRFDI